MTKQITWSQRSICIYNMWSGYIPPLRHFKLYNHYKDKQDPELNLAGLRSAESSLTRSVCVSAEGGPSEEDEDLLRAAQRSVERPLLLRWGDQPQSPSAGNTPAHLLTGSSPLSARGSETQSTRSNQWFVFVILQSVSETFQVLFLYSVESQRVSIMSLHQDPEQVFRKINGDDKNLQNRDEPVHHLCVHLEGAGLKQEVGALPDMGWSEVAASEFSSRSTSCLF